MLRFQTIFEMYTIIILYRAPLEITIVYSYFRKCQFLLQSHRSVTVSAAAYCVRKIIWDHQWAQEFATHRPKTLEQGNLDSSL
jgi:hypothetical protein